jgi:hypothetical protein
MKTAKECCADEVFGTHTQQSSETVKAAEGGIKVRVMARDKNWLQVNDPKSSTTGRI